MSAADTKNKKSPGKPRSKTGPVELGMKERGPRVVEALFSAGAEREEGLPAPAQSEFAFAGRSNVGKSSLLNALMQQRKLARTSSTPGCTRQLNVFSVRFDTELSLQFVDLPGYGYAKRSKQEKGAWGAMIEGYLGRRATLRALILLVDVRRGLEDDDLALIEFVRHARKTFGQADAPVLVVATKVDKVPKSKRGAMLRAIRRSSKCPVFAFSGETGEGRTELLAALFRAVFGDAATPVAQEGDESGAEEPDHGGDVS